ncbi:hypothetical protein [Rhizobium rhizogenes]|uniref:hypothetical protein n=1 Tax=Rhizobium rhizogenes TaxID=359 RepID=UPI0015729428|nr:hypothetical protein [Rhizobium rhizogenes]NTF64952.1 hypothetical protein [Rhizobium rhizogenes]NTG96300.1 hypothetical protein [Rhizobium rhizogenes]
MAKRATALHSNAISQTLLAAAIIQGLEFKLCIAMSARDQITDAVIGKRNMLKLFLSPGSSSMTPNIALHEIGADFEMPPNRLRVRNILLQPAWRSFPKGSADVARRR